MKNEEQIKKLTWKYFLQQKAWEVGKFLVIVGGIVFIPYWLGLLSEKWFGFATHLAKVGNLPNLFDIWFAGFFSSCGIAVVVGIFYGLYCWAKSNWEKATERAERDLQ